MEIISLKDSGEVGGRDGGCSGEGCSCGAHRITDLKPAARDTNRVNAYIDGEYEFSLDIAQVVELGVKVGREISEGELAELRAESEFGKLYQRALEWVLTRPHSVRETEDYLKRAAARRKADNKLRAQNAARSREERQKYHLKTKTLPEIGEKQMVAVLKRLIERGYLDDKKFAQYYIENRFVKKGVSRKRLVLELRGKGVAEEDIAAAMSETPRDETEEIRKVIAKKARKYSDPEKLIQYITRQGFDYQLTQSLVHEMDSQNWG